MDSGDVLAYSGEISGEFQSTDSAPKASTKSKDTNPVKITTASTQS